MVQIIVRFLIGKRRIGLEFFICGPYYKNIIRKSKSFYEKAIREKDKLFIEF